VREILFIMFVTWASTASATTYYVSSSTGSDSNGGNSQSAPWQTIANVNGQTFQPGDSILFKRGDVWNESLTAPSSGSSGNPITFDAYGTGAAPNLTGYYAVPSIAWVLVAGDAWKAPVPATFSAINFCLFGSIWGQKVGASTANLTAPWDFYLANGYIYVFATSNPATFYNEPIVPMALSNVPVINVNGKSWLTFQHFLVNWFDDYGVYVQGASDHLVFANMEADSMIPQGTQPLGFYVNESAPGPSDIKIYNSEAHLNYDAFRFDGAATAITMVNDKAYGNRDGALVDNTSAVSFSYCHFYASSLAVAGSTDVEWTSGSGPTAGAGNVAADTPPAVQVYQRYPAEVTLTVDDAGMTAGADSYYASQVLPVADTAGVSVGVAITVGYPLAQTLVSEFQGWINAGRDVTSHSMSHTYYTNTDALDIQYVGSGTAATLSISNKTFTITVTGASDSVSYSLAQGQAQGTIKALRQALQATGKFTATENPTCQGPYGTGCSAYTEAALLAQDLADVSGQNVESAVYAMQLDTTRLTTDEITLSRQWMTTNLTGLPATPVYVYPGGYETTAMQGIAAGIPYTGARGALKQDLGVKDTYADGFNVQNVTSFGVNPSWMGLQPAVLNQKIQALVWKQAVWGVPWGIFWHLNELTNVDPVGGTEITNLIQDFKASGATIQTNTSIVNWLLGGAQETGSDGNFYYKIPATSMTLDFRPTKNSPVVNAGQNLGTAYAIDINGVNQNSYGSGWEIGAHVFVGYATYGEDPGGAPFTIGEGSAASPAWATLPQVWVNNQEGNSLFSYELSLPNTWITGPAPSCTFHTPYWTGSSTFTGLQLAINDIEACRTAIGVGIALDVPPGLYTTSNASGLVIPQTNSHTSSTFLVLRSTQDANLPNGQTVCSHGIQDNLASSTDIGIDNPACNGLGMYYQMGTTITDIPAGAFTLANGLATNTSNYDDVQYMWTAESSGTNPAAVTFCRASGVATAPGCATNIGPDHWLIEDMEARMSAGNLGDSSIVYLPDNLTTAATQNAAHIHFRKIWIHGDWTSLTTGANSVSTDIQFSACTYCSVVDSATSESLRPGGEGHVIDANGIEYKFDHNWFEGQSSCVFAGGYASLTGPPIPGWVPYQDVEFRRNRCTFPYAWLGQSPVSTNPNFGTFAVVRKNAEENKEGERVLYAGNIFENVDNSGSQNGVLSDWNVWNSSNAVQGANYQAVISDVTFENNIGRNSCDGFEIDAVGRNVGGVSLPFQRGLWTNNLYYNASTTNPGCSNATSVGISLESSLNQWQGTVTESAAGQATFMANCSVFQGGCIGQIASISISGTCSANGTLTFSGGTQIAGGQAPLASYTCSGGAATAQFLPAGFGSGYTVAPTVTASGGLTATATLNTGSAAPATGFAVMDFIAGEPLYVTMCQSNSLFNVATTTYSAGTFPNGLGPKAAAGTNPNGLSVSYAWPPTGSITPGTLDNGGYCTISNFQGGPEQFQFTHNTFITDALNTLTSSNDKSELSGPNYEWNAVLQNDIMVGGGWDNNDLGEGCATANFNFDTNSLTNDHLVWPGRSSSLYAGCEYGNSPSLPVASPVEYFPATAYCAGASSTTYSGAGTGCVGFVGAMNVSSMPLTLPDYHQFELRSDSSFYAGNSAAASDGSSMGANIPLIDAAQTQNVFMCGSACESAGPYPDSGSIIPAQLLGMNLHPGLLPGGSQIPWPTIGFGAMRLWGTETTWNDLNPANGTYIWSTLDNWFSIAAANGQSDLLYTFGVVPTWASSNPTDQSCVTSNSPEGSCDPPSDLNADGTGTDQLWQNFVTALVNHAAGRIKYWEIWNEPDVLSEWTGTDAQLVRMAQDAYGIIHRLDLGALVTTPTPVNAGAGQSISGWLPGYIAAGGGAYADIVSFHGYENPALGNNAESILSTIATVKSLLNSTLLTKPLWDTEGAWTADINLPDPDMQAAFVARMYLLQWSAGVSRFYWFQYGNQMTGTLWTSSGLTEAGTAYGQISNWIVGNVMLPCSNISGTTWTCVLTQIGSGQAAGLVMWDTSQSCSAGNCGTVPVTIPAGVYGWYTHVDGTTNLIGSGVTTVQVGAKPILLSVNPGP
jgi:hypothetical protein